MMPDKLFYVVLSYYSRNTVHKIETPTITVYFIFAILFFCLYLDLFILGSLVIDYPKSVHRSKLLLIIVGIICTALVHFAFYRNGRYVEIYQRYRHAIFLNSSAGRRFYWGLLFILLTSPFTMGLLINKLVFGYWVH